ncbi:MAG: ABC transporter substrate-binding protein [Mucilaginibacter sp.]
MAAACSPKVAPVAVQSKKKKASAPVTNAQPSNAVKPAEKKVSDIALLLPFGLDHLSAGSSSYTTVTLKEADIALDYYRGFKLALDSLAGEGYNYKLQVFDSRGEKAQSHSLALNPAIRNSDLIVGPVFPGDIKAFTSAYPNSKQQVVSPLSPAAPATIKSQNLVTMTTPLEYHAVSAARYINNNIKPKKIFVLKSGYSEENSYIVPFRNTIDSLSKKSTQIVYLTVIHGQLGSLIPQLSKTSENVFVMPATNQHFITVTMRGLDSLAASYPVTLFGHPSWVNYTFLKADLLQRLNTHITSSDHVNFKDAGIMAFSRIYRAAYKIEPTMYAMKGFEEGMLLGKQLAEADGQSFLPVSFNGLLNEYHFQKKPGIGWINTHANVYKYTNFELKKVE